MSEPLREAAQRLVDIIFAEAQAEPFILPLRTMRAANDLRSALAATPSGALDELRALSDAASPGPWQWLDGEDEGDELQDGHGEMVATGFRENFALDGTPLNRDGSFAAAAVNYVRARLTEDAG